MKTADALIARYGGRDVPLAEICERYFGVSPEIAARNAAKGTLPVPAYRASESRKSPLLVRVDDLAQVLDARYERARSTWSVTRFEGAL
jgi:hypothetical protein